MEGLESLSLSLARLTIIQISSSPTLLQMMCRFHGKLTRVPIGYSLLLKPRVDMVFKR